MGGGGYLTNAGVFLVDILFSLYIYAVMLRLVLQLVRADFYNPLCQAILTITNPPLQVLRRFIPAFGRVDTASLVLMLILQLVASALILLMLGISVSPLGLFVSAIAELLSKAIYLFIFAIFVQIVISWVAPGTYNPVVGVIDAVTTPLLRPARRLLPAVGGIDFSPMLVIICLSLGLMLGVAPLRDLGRALM